MSDLGQIWRVSQSWTTPYDLQGNEAVKRNNIMLGDASWGAFSLTGSGGIECGAAANRTGIPQNTTICHPGDTKPPDARLRDLASRAPDIQCSGTRDPCTWVRGGTDQRDANDPWSILQENKWKVWAENFKELCPFSRGLGLDGQSL